MPHHSLSTAFTFHSSHLLAVDHLSVLNIYTSHNDLCLSDTETKNNYLRRKQYHNTKSRDKNFKKLFIYFNKKIYTVILCLVRGLVGALAACWAMHCANLLQEKQHYVNTDNCRPLHCLKYIHFRTFSTYTLMLPAFRAVE